MGVLQASSELCLLEAIGRGAGEEEGSTSVGNGIGASQEDQGAGDGD